MLEAEVVVLEQLLVVVQEEQAVAVRVEILHQKMERVVQQILVLAAVALLH
jgi:hypothetical protein